jgi:hypothetical protein
MTEKEHTCVKKFRFGGSKMTSQHIGNLKLTFSCVLRAHKCSKVSLLTCSNIPQTALVAALNTYDFCTVLIFSKNKQIGTILRTGVYAGLRPFYAGNFAVQPLDGARMQYFDGKIFCCADDSPHCTA